MVVSKHVLVGCQIKFTVVGSKLTEADCAILVDYTANFHDGVWSHSIWVTFEFNNLDNCVISSLHVKDAVLDTVNFTDESDGFTNKLGDLILTYEWMWFSVNLLYVLVCCH